jgi:hypothetical protein
MDQIFLDARGKPGGSSPVKRGAAHHEPERENHALSAARSITGMAAAARLKEVGGGFGVVHARQNCAECAAVCTYIGTQ